jgi:hypothetical protein
MSCAVRAVPYDSRMKIIALALMLACSALQAATPEPTPPEAALEIAHQPVATFRASYNGADPAGRLARAQTRLEEARTRELPPVVDMVPVTLERQRGVAFRQGDVLLFTLTEADIEPGAHESLDHAARATHARLSAALKSEAEQRQWPIVLRALGVSLLETLLLNWPAQTSSTRHRSGCASPA